MRTLLVYRQWFIQQYITQATNKRLVLQSLSIDTLDLQNNDHGCYTLTIGQFVDLRENHKFYDHILKKTHFHQFLKSHVGIMKEK